MSIEKCIVCKDINDTKEHKIIENVNIVSCNNEYCKNKVINTIDNVNKIEKYFNKNKSINTDYIMNGGGGGGGGGNEFETDDFLFLKSILDDIKRGDIKSPIIINEATAYKIMATLIKFKRKILLLYILLGSLQKLVEFFNINNIQEDDIEDEKFKTSLKEFIENPGKTDIYELKIKTNVLSVDYDLSSGEKVPNFIRLKFENFGKLIDFIAKIDFDYIDHPEENRNKYKYDIYSSLFEDDRDNDIKKDDAIFKTLDDKILKKNNIYLTLIENIEQYGKKYFQPKKKPYEKEYKSISKTDADEDENENKKEPLIRALVSIAKKQLKVPKHFIYSFRDKMKDGVDIFTLLLAFVTNIDIEWNFEFYETAPSGQTKIKYNFIQYIFELIIGKYYKFINETELDNEKKIVWDIENEIDMLILFLKLSMLIPIFFGFQKHFQKIILNYIPDKLFNNLGENLVYIIMEIEAINFKEPDYERGKIIINILNKYWIFNYKNLYTYVEQQNFTNNLYIENLNEIEKFGITYENLFEEDKLEFITKKIEMWIFYLITGSFIINEYYTVMVYYPHRNRDLYIIYRNQEEYDYIIELKFNFFLDTTTIYKYNIKTYIERLIEKYPDMTEKNNPVVIFVKYRRRKYLPIPFFVESMVDYLNKKKMIK